MSNLREVGKTRTAARGRLRAHLVGLLAALLPLVYAGVSWGYTPANDPFSMAKVTSHIAATTWWNAGYTGAGIDIALIDTGVSPVEGLATPGKLIYGPDLSLESQSPDLAYLDTNGHGTFMAGLIAGKDSTLTAPYASAPAAAYRGVAPDARIISLKVATADGGVDVSQVIAAINWVIQNKNANGMNIRVINLSYGTNSAQAATIDPLSYAVEQAWKKGIVVVAAAGNSGYQDERGLSNPAYNRYVIGVGGYDTMGTSATGDDLLGAYSAGIASSSQRGPDFVAAGSHLQGLRVTGSFLDQNHPEGIIDGRYFRGSGTSQAAAITSGTVALILQKYPTLTPDRVKRFIATNTVTLQSEPDPDYSGSGEISLGKLASKTPPTYTQIFPNGTGTGTLEGSRGTDHLSIDGVVLQGEKDIFGSAYNAAAMAVAMAAGTTWSAAGDWNGNRWSGNSWSGNRWSTTVWAGNRWSGNSWSGLSWSGNRWSGNRWSGTSWSGNSWSGNRWSGNSWATGSWS